MKIEAQFKQKVREAMLADRENYGGSDTAYAKRLKLSAAIYSQIKNGKIDKVLSDTQWLVIAHQLGVQVNDSGWKVARTQVYTEIEDNLLYCKTYSKSMILVDDCGIGKTFCTPHRKTAEKRLLYRLLTSQNQTAIHSLACQNHRRGRYRALCRCKSCY
mgnify:CR=1 FL=1